MDDLSDADVALQVGLVELVREAQEGSHRAAQILFDRCRGPLIAVIRRTIYRPLRRIYDSDDFLLATFAEVFTRHFTDEVLRSPASLWPYLKRIAENKVRDAERKYLVSERHNISRDISLSELRSDEELCSKDLSPHDVFVLKELVEERLNDLVSQLPRMLRQIVQLLMKGQLGVQVADQLGVEPKRVYRAMAWLKKKIEES